MGNSVLSEVVKISTAIKPSEGVAGATDLNGAILDMAGFDGVLMEATFGAIVSGAATSVKVQQDTDSAMGAAADLAGTSQTVADTDDDKTFYIDLYRPKERYVRLVVKRATQNATVSARYVQYRARTEKTTHAADISGEIHLSPAEGTA